MVDLIPALRYVPDWVPGTGWKKVAKYYREMSLLSRVTPFRIVQDLVVSNLPFGGLAYGRGAEIFV